jgi:hypothetical protein
MPVTFSKGALKEMSTRHISWDEVDSTLTQPDTISMDPEGNIVVLKLIHEHVLRIAYKLDAGLRVVKKIEKTEQQSHL